MPPASMPITRLGGMAGRYTEVCDRPEAGALRSTRSTARRKHPLARGGGDLDALEAAARPRHRQASPTSPASARAITPGRVLKWVALAVVGWLLLSLVLFLVSAQVAGGRVRQRQGARSRAGAACSPARNILVLGSDARTGDVDRRGPAGPSRADTIMLVHAGLGSVRKLSIPRDT